MNKLFVAALKEETIGLNNFNYIGVGKINATYNLTKLIHKYKPLEVINYGTAGSVKKGLSATTVFLPTRIASSSARQL